MTDHAIAALVECRRLLMGEVHGLQARLYTIQSDLTALNAVIRQLDPEYELATVRAKCRRAPIPGEYAAISRSVLDVLRRAKEPQSAAQIATTIFPVCSAARRRSFRSAFTFSCLAWPPK